MCNTEYLLYRYLLYFSYNDDECSGGKAQGQLRDRSLCGCLESKMISWHFLYFSALQMCMEPHRHVVYLLESNSNCWKMFGKYQKVLVSALPSTDQRTNEITNFILSKNIVFYSRIVI